MKQVPELLDNSNYKYNIIARLLLFKGGESTLRKHKKELMLYAKGKAIKETTFRKWVVIPKGAKQEIPVSALKHFANYFNEKYRKIYPEGSVLAMKYEPITVEDLYFAGQLY